MSAPDRIAEVVTAFGAAFSDGSLVRLKLGGYHGPEAELKSVEGRKVAIKAGDRFVSVSGAPVHSVGGVEDRMALAKKRNITFEWRSGGETHAGNVGPLIPEGTDKYCMVSPDFGVRFGAPGLPMAPIAGEMVTIHFGPGEAMLASLKRLPASSRRPPMNSA